MTALWLTGATVLLTLAGGFLVLRLRAYQGVVFAFCAGALIAGALLEVVPEAMAMLSSSHVFSSSAGSVWFEPRLVLVSCVAGFLCFYVVEHLTHQRETPRQQAAHHAHAPHAGVWGALGILVHSFFDGFAIGTGFHADEQMGWTIGLGVALHKIADGASVAGVMLGTRRTVRSAAVMVALTALAPPAGLFAGSFVVFETGPLALLLGWCGGVFLYLGAGSLLPAAHDASASRLLPAATLTGVLFVYAARVLTHG